MEILKRAPIFLLFPLIVLAHRVDLFVGEENGKLQVWSYYSDGTPAKGADIKIYSPDGKLLFEGKTDAEGKLVWEPPKGITEVKVVLYAGLGHKSETTYTFEEASLSIPPQTGEAKTPEPQKGKNAEEPPEGNSYQFHPKEEVDWSKIFCGIGWILGIFGILNLLNGLRKKKQN